MTLSENLKRTMAEKGMSATTLALLSGVPSSRISEIGNGRTLNPRMETLKKLADALDVPLEDLMDHNEIARIQVNARLAALKNRVRMLGDEQRPQQAFDIPASVSKIPIVSWAQAGQEGFFEDSYPPGAGFGEINRPYDLTDPNAYALIISGDSMAPKYEPGDLVVVSPAAVVNSGDYAVVKLKNGEVAAKRVKEKNSHYILESVNPDYEPREVMKDIIVFVHRIVWVKQRG